MIPEETPNLGPLGPMVRMMEDMEVMLPMLSDGAIAAMDDATWAKWWDAKGTAVRLEAQTRQRVAASASKGEAQRRRRRTGGRAGT